MKNHLFRNFVFGGFLLLTSACVTVKIPTGAGKRATDVRFENPESPFEEVKIHAADKAWLSAKTGNNISFVSDCNGSADPSLQELESGSLAAFSKLKIIESKNIEFNGRDGLHTLAQGEVDGIPVKTEIIVFKKNNCNYTLSYGGIMKSFEEEKGSFQKFAENFKAQ